MVTKKEVLSQIELLNKDRVATYAEFIVDLMKDKFVELYLGDSYEEIKTEQVSVAEPAVFCGKVVAAYKECLVLQSIVMDEKTMSLGSLVFVNERAIRALSEIDGVSSVSDFFLKSKNTLDFTKKSLKANQ